MIDRSLGKDQKRLLGEKKMDKDKSERKRDTTFFCSEWTSAVQQQQAFSSFIVGGAILRLDS